MTYFARWLPRIRRRRAPITGPRASRAMSPATPQGVTSPSLTTGGASESTVVTPTAWTGSGSRDRSRLKRRRGQQERTSDRRSSPTQRPERLRTLPGASRAATGHSQTTAAAGGNVLLLPYTYSGSQRLRHFNVTVGLVEFVTDSDTGSRRQRRSSVNDSGPAICCTSPSARLLGYSGTATLQERERPGDTYGFMISGSNFDSNAVLQGTLTVNIAGATTIATTATPCCGEPVQAVTTLITDSATLGGLTATSGGTRLPSTRTRWHVLHHVTDLHGARPTVNGAGGSYLCRAWLPRRPSRGTFLLDCERTRAMSAPRRSPRPAAARTSRPRSQAPERQTTPGRTGSTDPR